MGASTTLDALTERVIALQHSLGRRAVIGIVGPPGAGKSTLAERLTARVRGAALLPMDGFHLAQEQLVALGREARKGAPDTFDSAGYIELLRRARRGDGDVFAPRFDRSIEEPIAAAIRIPASATLVVTEGNYLMHEGDGWSAVADLLDESWYLDPPTPLRVERLTRRHVEFGRTPTAAGRWVAEVDERNARVIERARERCSLVIETWDD